MIKFEHHGSFKKIELFFSRAKRQEFYRKLHKTAELGVQALAAATPKDSGETAASWSYEIVKGHDGYHIYWTNSNFNQGIPIAILIQYGHGLHQGGYVKGIDYINPAMKPVFDKLTEEVWGEVIK